MDGWQNFATLLGTSSDKRMYSELRWDNHPPEFYEQIYAGGGIPARIVDLIPDESLRHWIEWTGVDKKKGEELHDVCEQYGLRTAIGKTWKWGRAYGGSCLHLVTDTNNPAGPLQKGEKILGFIDLSRWDLRILTTDIEFDFASPNWGHPRMYYLNVQMGSQFKGYPIHWTRMERFDGQLVPRRTFIRNNYWHDSILNRVYNSIRNYETANDAAASCLMDFNVDVFSMKNLAQLMSSGKEALVKQRLEMMNFSKSVINAMLIDPDQESYENKGRSLEGVAELLVHQANRLVAETDIPHTKLLGESPDGSNATGNSTSQQWYNFIGSEQENYLRPKLKRIFSLLFPDIPELGFKFKSLRVMDDTEKSDVRLKVAQADQVYLDHGVLDPSEVVTSRFGGDEYSIETKIDKEGRASGAIDPAADEVDPGEEPSDDEGNDEGPDEKLSDKPETPRRSDLTGKAKKDAGYEVVQERNEKTGVEGQPGTQFDLRNEMHNVPHAVPKTESFVSQTMSEPMRDPRTDPPMKGPGIPNKPRTMLPTRGTGVTAQSGYDFVEDPKIAETASVEGQGIETEKQATPKKDSDERRRAATIIVRKGDKFLMGSTNADGKWTLPGGMVEDKESSHQGGVRELAEETGLQASKLKFLGSRLVENEMGKPTEVAIFEHQHKDGEKITTKKDPDQEVAKWRWFSTKDELPEDVLGNLKHVNNVALVHLKLLK